ncbi:MAG: hypothetical protein SFW08_11965 [Gemmatimonadaceae bacterium]|nr:hypothetical protein [Gemmatimonadaceae bacterium]
MLRRALLLLALAAAPLSAQFDWDHPEQRWRTIRTEHFRIHYTPGLETWAKDIASRIEATRAAVGRKVGYLPPQTVDILVEDPLNVPNGNAWPSQFTPAMRFWATPPDPTTELVGYPGWSAILSVHEFAHIAHLMRPSRKRNAKLATAFNFPQYGPVAQAVPGWVSEGYATLIEGELTGAGRPHNVARPAFIRQLALEGAMPSYSNLDNVSVYAGGSVRYLIGSAFVEWLQQRGGDSSLVHLWRRLSAKQTRTFDEAFIGVFGEAPAVLYGQFTAEVYERTAEARRRLTAAGLAVGTRVMRGTDYVGAPAVSHDGSKLAIRFADTEGHMVVRVVTTAEAPTDSAAEAAVAKQLADDPEDVRAVRMDPAPRKTLATLHPIAGIGFDTPRWFADHERVLVTRSAVLGDGRRQYDVYEWNTKTGATRRVTRRAGVREADPFPDGQRAAGLACGGGTCGLVRIDLASGRTTALVAGTLDRPFSGVRVSPSGRMVASAIRVGPLWRVVIVDAASGAVREIGPNDGVSRYAPSWIDDETVAVVSELGGVTSIERLPLDGAPATVARAAGAVGFPDAGRDGRVWFLEPHTRGADVRVLEPRAATIAALEPLPVALAPVAQRPPQAGVPLASAPVAESAPYRATKFGASVAFTGNSAVDGETWGVGAAISDVVGRVQLRVVAGDGSRGTWTGGSARLTYRGFRPNVVVQAWATTHEPSGQRSLGGAALLPLDAAYTGGLAALDLDRRSVHGSTRYRLGGSFGRLEYLGLPGSVTSTRQLGFGEFTTSNSFTPSAALRLGYSLGAHVSAGTTRDSSWQRALAHLGVDIGPYRGPGLGLRAMYGGVSTGAPAWEQFTYGGAVSPYVDQSVLSHRMDNPGLPFAVTAGRKFASASVETTGPIRLFHQWFVAGESLREPGTQYGAEFRLSVPYINIIHFPGLETRFGVSRSERSRYANRDIAYFIVSIAP